tara:strand:- start:279 stop:677 length:399 start_codon:yes stop_codon:yes gene_type:complete
MKYTIVTNNNSTLTDWSAQKGTHSRLVVTQHANATEYRAEHSVDTGAQWAIQEKYILKLYKSKFYVRATRPQIDETVYLPETHTCTWRGAAATKLLRLKLSDSVINDSPAMTSERVRNFALGYFKITGTIDA